MAEENQVHQVDRAGQDMGQESASPVFGILYPGEMGAAFGRILAGQGFEVRTALRGRSQATRARAVQAGMQDMAEVGCLLNQVDYLLSFVPPGAARTVAESVAEQASPQGRLAFVDFNSIGSDVAVDIAHCLGEKGIDFIDGSIHGQARNLGISSAVYLSGPRSHELVEILPGSLRVHDLGPDLAAASCFKMLLSSLSKSLVALFLEVGLFAREANQLPFFLEQARSFYPGLMEAVERMAPTYPRHVNRRVQEMENVEQAISLLGLQPGIIAESRRFLEAFAAAALPASASGSVGWTVEEIIEALAAAGVLRAVRPSPGLPQKNEEGVKAQ